MHDMAYCILHTSIQRHHHGKNIGHFSHHTWHSKLQLDRTYIPDTLHHLPDRRSRLCTHYIAFQSHCPYTDIDQSAVHIHIHHQLLELSPIDCKRKACNHLWALLTHLQNNQGDIGHSCVKI